jgi:3'(2'), 5'-bisphosphate nucleotidase
MPDPTDYLSIAVAAALEAGQAIMDVYRTGTEVEYKADRSPLTQADKRAHAVIREKLSGTPYPLLSEEGREIPYDERKDWRTFWLVDPLDGTKEFIKRNGEFTVNIALVRDGMPVLGVVYAPALHRFYFGAENLGSYRLNETTLAEAAGLDAQQLLAQSVRLPRPQDKRPFTVVASRSHLSPETKAFVNTLKLEHGEVAFISSGSSLKLCLVAEGRADIYPRLAPTMEWDTAAGHAVVNGAGKRVRHYDSREPLHYNKENLLNPWFIVG